MEREKDFCIVLGRETSGFNKELQMCDLIVVIDTKTKYRTINILHGLAILLWDIKSGTPKSKEVMLLISHLRKSLMEIKREKMPIGY